MSFAPLYIVFLGLIFSNVSEKLTTNIMIAVIVFVSQYFTLYFFPSFNGFDGWWVFAIILGRFLGIYHPPSPDETPLDWKRKTLGWLSLLIFILLMYSWLHAYSTKINLNTLEGAVIFASVLSFFAFAIKTLSKLTFSAYHLQRDAEEREQLTHLYLALSNDNKVDAESRNIVLQALFSRSDSGLLAGDHSPTMPSIQDAIKATGR